jgi:shikimate dehydrogenase
MPHRQFGLIGYPLGHSFSKGYFTAKFEREGIPDAAYELYPLAQIGQLEDLLRAQPNLCGLNVTIPYKQAVIPYLHRLDSAAEAAGAVNCIRITQEGHLIGYNTDIIGFEQSLRQVCDGRWASPDTKALILGTGGAAKAVAYVLRTLGIAYRFVTRTREAGIQDVEMYLTYADLYDRTIMPDSPDGFLRPTLIINTTPLGMAPHVDTCPDIPLDRIGPAHLVFDLVYNPAMTLLLQRAAERGAATQNGLDMLYGQAEAAWMIWSS